MKLMSLIVINVVTAICVCSIRVPIKLSVDPYCEWHHGTWQISCSYSLYIVNCGIVYIISDILPYNIIVGFEKIC